MQRRPAHEDLVYRTRFLTGLLGSLCIVLGLLLYWPEAQKTPEPVGSVHNNEIIAIELVAPTLQVEAAPTPPPPPAPLPPIEVPDDVIIFEEESFEILDEIGIEGGLPGSLPGNRGTTQGTSAPPEPERPTVSIGPRLVRIVTPEYTPDARRKKIRAQIEVRVDIDEKGRVLNPRITGMYLLDGDGGQNSVAEIGFGLEAAALAAASRHQFRPARQDGVPVPSSYVLDMKFGIE